MAEYDQTPTAPMQPPMPGDPMGMPQMGGAPVIDMAMFGIEQPRKVHKLIKQLDDGNLVGKLEKLKDETPASVYQGIIECYEEAKASMDKWLVRYNKALKLAKMQPFDASGNDLESKSFPFDGASLAMMPFILEAMLDFSSRASPELVWTDKIAAAKVQGMDQEQSKMARAIRVETYLNYQLQNDIPGWRNGQDKLIMALPCVGTVYKKTYYDYQEKAVCSDLRMADKIIFDFGCDTFDDAPNKFEDLKLTRNQVIGYIRGEEAWDMAEKDLEKDKKEFEFIEAHTWIDLDEDGLEEPYCAILHPDSGKIICLYPDYDEESIAFNDNGKVVKITDKGTYTQYIFLPDPEGGPMGMGWGILLGPTFMAINTLVRDNIDAGTLALTSSNSGLIAQSIGEGRGNRQLSSQIKVKMGELTPYPMGATNGSLRDNVVQFPFAGPNAVLFQLTEYLAEAARRLSTAAYSVDANPGEAASLYLARLQQGLKIPNSIVMRVYECAKQELEKIALLDFKHHDSKKYNKVLDEPQTYIMQRDFDPDDCDIVLFSDPAQGSDIERIAKAQNVYGMAMEQVAAQQNVMNLRAATIALLKAQSVDDAEIEQLAPEPDPDAPPPKEMQLILAQQQFEAELKQKALDLEQQRLEQNAQKMELDRLKQAHMAAKELSELGLKADLDEATITEKYASALAKIIKETGMTFDAAKDAVLRMEVDVIDSSQPKEVANAIPSSIPRPDSALAGPPGNTGISQLPGGLPPGAV